jgi:aminopeptidase N
MKSFPRSIALAAILCAVAASACARAAADELSEDQSLLCRGGAALFSAAESAGDIKYAPDRKVEIVHLALDVTPDFEKRTVRGEITFTFKPIGKPLDELRLDGVDLTVHGVECTAKLAGHQVTDKEIVVTFAEPLAPGRETRLTIRYSAQPIKGLYFRVPSNGYRAEDAHIWSQGETTEAPHWFPCYDYPNSKFTSEITCRVPEGMTVLSNGRQVSSEKDPATGLVAVRWSQEKPHSNYLITLVAGHFVKLEDVYRDIPLRFYTPPSEAKEAPLTFAETKPAMEFFEREIGVPFPWAQYGQVVVHDFTWGGMENTTLTTLTEWTLHTPDTENIHTSEGLVAHEMAHQWFGDLVTCKDWSQVWLNEGFATYYAMLFAGHKRGRDQMLYELYQNTQSIIHETDAPKPIVFRRYKIPFEQFDNRAYGKGAWVLHMLRSQLGDDLYRRCIKTYLKRHQFQTVVTEDLNAVIEELSGRSFDGFFDQWVYHAWHPELEVSYNWDDKTKLAKVSVCQQQKLSDQVLVFHFPVTLRFKTKDGTVDHRVEVKEKEEDFYVPLKQAPEIVRFDPEFSVLAKIDFKLPNALLYAQLADKTDVVGRLIAAEQLGEKKDATTIAKLKEALNGDEFYGVRIKASASLKKIHSDEALEALIASVKQPDARARNAVITDIAGFFNARAYEALRRSAETERNPAILAAAIRGLGPYHQPEVRDALLTFLNSESYHNRLAEAAIAAMRTQDDPGYIEPLREVLSKRETAFLKTGLGHGLDALGFLARNEKPKDSVREFLNRFVNHKRERIQLAAMKALGSLEDPKAIPLLETFTATAKQTPQHEEADKAIAVLRAANKPSDNLKDLRKEMLDLQQANRELKKDVDDVKKRLKASEEKEPEKQAGEKTTSDKKADDARSDAKK